MPVNHTLWDTVLSRYVDHQGLVDYHGIAADSTFFEYLTVLESTQPSQLESHEALAYWINAYNAFTIKLVAENYPVKSILDITPFRIKGLRLTIPKLNSPFEYKVATIEGKQISLDHIEHGILRVAFDEPRIHFAIVCASISCPQLRREAYHADRIEEQLQDQAQGFVRDAARNTFDPEQNTFSISKIFKWFEEDFGRTSVAAMLYAASFLGEEERQQINAETRIRYLKYDWGLNDIRPSN